jgi:hypothetical protein
LVAAAGCAEPASAGKGDAAPEGTAVGVAVVELFTSEGCSSCPPADDLLGELAADARANGRPVYALAFHVDYWNYIGWTDPFSDAAWSRRQSQYAQAFRNDQVYTPQMVVNGRTQFVGSDRAKARAAITNALSKPPTAVVRVRVTGREGTALQLGYHVEGAPAGAVLNLAVVESGLSTRVPRGENAGRSLRHANVVRAFRTVALDGKADGAARVEIPAAVKAENADVIAYVQRPADMAVLGAASAPLAAGDGAAK